jgi:hypothetical protein
VTHDRYGRIFESERSSAVTVADARTRAAAALIRRGYRITADDGGDPSGAATLVFTRGSRLRSVVAMSPDSWYVTGRIHLDPDGGGGARVTVAVDATRSAQVPSASERAYWDRETAFLGNAAAGDEQPDIRPDSSPIRRQSLLAVAILIVTAAIGAIIGNRLDGSDGSAAFIFAIVGFLVGAAIVWRWLGLSGERPTS